VRRLKFVAHVEAGQSPPSELVVEGSEGLAFLQGNADFGALNPSPRQVCDAAPKRAEVGDILLSVRAPVGALNIADRAYGIGRGLCAIRPARFFDRNYFYHLLGVTRSRLDSVATGSTYDAVTASDVGNLPALVPDLAEQRDIATFLERQTADVDALVARKERLIEVLGEKRAALVGRAVTKGLDPNVQMKDSGVEWLGAVPTEWVCLALARVTLSRCDGPFGSGMKSEHYSNSGVRVVRLQNIGWAEYLDSDRAYVDEAYAIQLGDHGVVGGDLLIAGLGDDGHLVGRACVAPDDIAPAMVKADCFRFRLDRRKVLPAFAAYQLSATATAAFGMATGATRSRMNLTTTATRPIALPPLNEQGQIVEVLDQDRAIFVAATARIRDAIERLKELRSALISAAITGKIDVRVGPLSVGRT
jgi:type I restriction enzyme S subunit